MPKTTDQQSILLLGSYGRGNLGDDAFLLAAMELFAGYKLYINAAHTALLPKAVRANVTPLSTTSNRDILHKIRVFLKVRHVVYCGGDVWVELYENRFRRMSLYKMLVVNLVARLFGKRVHYLGVGIGKLSGFSLTLARWSASLANDIVVREPRSAQVLNTGNMYVLPDLVTNLKITPHPKPKRHDGKFVIGISILYHLPNPETEFPKLIATLKAVLSTLPTEQFKIVLFPMLVSPDDERDDAWASEQLHKALPNADISIFEGREVDEYVDALREVDLVIGARLHANIIAMLAGVPCLGISYRPKVAQFFEMHDLADYYINLDQLDAESLTAKLLHMYKNHPSITTDFQTKLGHLTQKRGYENLVQQF